MRKKGKKSMNKERLSPRRKRRDQAAAPLASRSRSGSGVELAGDPALDTQLSDLVRRAEVRDHYLEF